MAPSKDLESKCCNKWQKHSNLCWQLFGWLLRLTQSAKLNMTIFWAETELKLLNFQHFAASPDNKSAVRYPLSQLIHQKLGAIKNVSLWWDLSIINANLFGIFSNLRLNLLVNLLTVLCVPKALFMMKTATTTMGSIYGTPCTYNSWG